jgi:DegV family protein with EDD domain
MKIVTDCAADLQPDEVKQYGITVAPLYIQFPEGEVNSAEITPDQFYDRLEKMAPQVPTTAQPSAGIFAELYRKLGSTNDEIMSIHISSGLSGTIDSARLGIQNVPNRIIHLVDAMTLSGGERFQVLAAAFAARAGKSKEFVLDRLAKIREATEVVYTLETLEYLQRGGRIGRVQALAGMLLRIKPIIHVDKKDGKYTTLGKERTVPKALETITEHISEKYGSQVPLWVTVLHGRFAEQAERLATMMRERVNVAKLEVLRISPVLGVHTGPGIVGLAVVPMELMEGLE